jgi:hypothetical protein
MRKFLKCLVLVAIFGLANIVTGQSAPDSSRKIMTAVKIDKPITLTGKMDNPEWLKADPVELKYEVTPGENTPAGQKTLVRAMYDQNYLYFGFQCFDTTPELIRANISDRDKIYQDDWVFVGIDTYGDYQRSYELVVNCYGIQGDLLATSNGEDGSVDWIWYGSAARNDKGWTAEMKVPFSSLNFPDQNEQTWRLNIIRCLPRASRTQTSWTPFNRNISGIMTQAGWLTGLKNIKAGSSVELLPYAMGQKNGQLTDSDIPNSGFKYDDIQGRIGGGIKYSPSPNFSLDAVINPDFSQIESDAAQISVNTTFALSYSEKRPFFLIGRDLLSSDMYYSRSINDPLGAARIIGKTGGLSYLYMGAYDRHTVLDIPGEERSNIVETGMKSFVNIGRLRYDIANETYIGGLVMTRDLSGGHNYVLGLDWNYKFWNNWYFTGEGNYSFTKELNDTSLFSSSRQFGDTGYNAAFSGESYNGNGLHLNLYHTSRDYYFGFRFNNYSPTYQTYNGIFDQVGYRQFVMIHEYDFYPTKSFIDNGGFGFNAEARYDFYGKQKEQFLQPYLFLTMKGQTNINLQYLVVNDENFQGIWFRGIHRGYFGINTRPANEIYISTNIQLGKFIYRNDTPSMGKGHNFNLNIVLKPTSQFNFEFAYSRARLSSDDTDELYYDGNIYRAVAIYQFTSEIFFRTILQYDTFAKNFQVYPLFSYKLSAFTTFYAGATSSYFNYEGDNGIVNTNQQYFIKVQYLFGI